MNKKRRPRSRTSLFFCLVLLSSLRKALAAVHSLAFGRIEGHFRFLTALSANRNEHLAGTLGGVLSGITASLASLGLILEALLCIELLLTGGEHEILAAILAFQRFVLKHFPLPFWIKKINLPPDGFQPTPL